jgi:Prealbumin-like fold domain
MRTLLTRLRSGRLRLVSGVTLVVALALAIPVFANLTGSPFDAGDGNLVVNDEAQDWANAPNLRKALDITPAKNDNSFGQGTKEDDEVPTIVTGSIPPNKSDLTRFYVANERVATMTGSKEFLYLAWERVQEPNGTTNMDFEFNQSTQLSSNGVTPERTAGDVLIKYDLAQGGTHPDLGFHRWVTSGTPATVCEASNTVPCWGPVQSLAGNFEGSINDPSNNPPDGSVVDPIPPDAPRTLSPRTFGEAAINLTDSGILPAGQCEAFSGAYLKSRASDSFTSAVKDFIAPIPVSIRNCGEIIIKKVTDPSPDPTNTSFAFTLTGGPSSLNQSFSLKNGEQHSSGAIVAGSGYSAAETVPTGWSLESATCSDGSPVTNIDVSVNETVTCTFTNKTRGTINIHKEDDEGNALAGAVFTLFVDNAPLDGPAPHGTGDTATTKTCTTDLTGNCTIADVVPGQYWVVETTGVPNHGLAPDQNVIIGAGTTLSLTFVNPRLHTVIVLVCHEGTNTLAASDVVNGSSSATSLAEGATLPDGVSEADLCGLGGARFAGKPHGTKSLTVDVGSDAH